MQSNASIKKLVRRERSYAWLVAFPLFIGSILFWGLILLLIFAGFVSFITPIIDKGEPWWIISIYVIAFAIPACSFLYPLRMILWPIFNPVGYCESNMGVVFVQDNEEYSALTEVINDLAKKAGLKKIAYIGIQPEDKNAFAFGFLPSKSVVAIGEDLFSRMNSDELRAIIGHEIGHIASRDCLALTMVFTVKSIVEDGILKPFQRLLKFFGFGFIVGGVFIFPRSLPRLFIMLCAWAIGLYILAIYTGVRIVTWVLKKLVEFLECWLSRRREYKADRVGSLLAGKENMLSALQGLRAISGTRNLQLASDPFASFKFANFKQLGSSREWTWLSDTHPPMGRRIEALVIGKNPPMTPLARWTLTLAAISSCCWFLISLGMKLAAEATLSQPLLFEGLQFASLSGAILGFLYAMQRTGTQRVLLGLLALLSWRICYFPIMVFSGHVAAIAEWLLLKTPLPVFVYPVFLAAVALLHAVAAVAACSLLLVQQRWLRAALAPAFIAALCVSFAKPADLHPLPDSNWSLARVKTRVQLETPDAPASPPRQPRRNGNPYLAALAAPGYWPHQRVVLLAAGLTYGAIPPSPWALTVRDVLAQDFEAQPYGSAALRVSEHYLAYHAAHRQIHRR